MQESILRICQNVAEAFGGHAEVTIRPGYGAVYNSDRYYPVIEQVAQEVFGKDHMILRDHPSLGVEGSNDRYFRLSAYGACTGRS